MPPILYGRSELMMGRVMEDVHRADPEWNIDGCCAILTPLGRIESGLIAGEESTRCAGQLMLPCIAQVAVNGLSWLCSARFGDDYPTQDGTGTRDVRSRWFGARASGGAGCDDP